MHRECEHGGRAQRLCLAERRQDGRRQIVAEIDTRRCPLYLLAGEYDYSCTPDDTRELARRIQAAQATIMDGMGQLSMSESPERFLSYLRRVLADIEQHKRL